MFPSLSAGKSATMLSGTASGLHIHYSLHMPQPTMATVKVSPLSSMHLTFGRLTFGKVRFLGTKFLVHRITFRHKYGQQMDEDQELSHLVNCGLRTPS
jgi:hypothetical protein